MTDPCAVRDAPGGEENLDGPVAILPNESQDWTFTFKFNVNKHICDTGKVEKHWDSITFLKSHLYYAG